jgi:hypothetical protein
MNRSLLAPRLWYVVGAIATATIAAALTSRRDGFSVWLLATIVVSTAMVASVASFALITRDGPARLGQWLLAGFLVPILAVIGFLETNFVIGWILHGSDGGIRALYWASVTVGSMITIPMGVVASIVLLWAIRKRFYGSALR